MAAATAKVVGTTGIAPVFGLALTLVVASSAYLGGADIDPAVMGGF